jgi:integrase
MKFTDRSIQAIKPQEKRFEVWETNGKGFGLRVQPTGRKSWVFLYRFQGKVRRMTFGEYPGMGLADAHVAHANACKLLEKEIDPGTLGQAVKEEARTAPTVGDLVTEFIEKGLKLKGNRSWKEYERNLKKDVLPEWEHRKAKHIKKRDVILLLEKVLGRGAKNQSSQVFKIVRRMFNFAVERGIIEVSPCAQVKTLSPDVQKERFLSLPEIKTFWLALNDCAMSDDLKRVLRLILITAQRPGEVIGASAAEISGAWWTIPAERSKNKKSHRVYLTPLALDLFQAKDKEGLLFPSPRRGKNWNPDAEEAAVKPIQVNALAHALRRAMTPHPETEEVKLPVAHFTPHDLRRTAASHMASLGFGVVVDKVLNHTDQRVTAIYDRYDYDKEKQQALESWTRKVEGILNDKPCDNVVDFRRG